jgi:phage terminase large subunit-like protein
MREKFKNFRVDDEILKRYEELKSKENLTSDTDFFVKMLNYTEAMQSNSLVPIDFVKEKDEKINKLFLEFGKLQGELNIYKQQALPKKSFWKRLFGG